MLEESSAEAQDSQGQSNGQQEPTVGPCGACSAANVHNRSKQWVKIAGTLTGDEMREHKMLSLPPSPEEEEEEEEKKEIPHDKYQATTFDLRLGEGHYLYGKNSDKKWRCIYIGEGELDAINQGCSEKFSRPEGPHPNTLTIPPFGSALVQLHEIVDTLTVAEEKKILLVGRFDLKLSNVHQGLISQQATQVEPCYRGRLFCFLHNLSSKEVKLKYKDDLATIEFSYVSCIHNEKEVDKVIASLKEKNHSKSRYNKKYCSCNGIDDIRYFYETGKLPDECGLLSFYDMLIKKTDSKTFINSVASVTASKMKTWQNVVIAALAAIATIMSSFIGSYYVQKSLLKDAIKEQLIEITPKFTSIEEKIKGITVSLQNSQNTTDYAIMASEVAQIKKDLASSISQIKEIKEAVNTFPTQKNSNVKD